MKKTLVLAMALAAVCIMPSCEKNPKPNETTTGTLNGHEYVDLGLPSGTLWATCNVGADTPESYGDYFAWGETSPKDTYSWETYKWCKGSQYTLTKYCSNSSYGTVDNKTVLDPEDDAAQANWGGTWRMPTHDEFTELRTKCTCELTSLNGVYGRKVTGPNGNSIFLPAAGYRYDSSLYNAGSYGLYWSSTAVSSSKAYYLVLNLSNVHPGMVLNYGYYGWSVRCVVSGV